MYKFLARMALALACAFSAMAAQAQVAYTAKAVNLRAGPAPGYPVVAVVDAGLSLQVQGCLSDYSWCDVIAGPYRGWVYAGNIDYAYEGQYVPLLEYGPQLGIVIVGFTLWDYWDRHYTRQPFFRDRDRWAHYPPPPPHRPGHPAPPAPPMQLQPPQRVPPAYRPPPLQRPAPSYPAQPPVRVLPSPAPRPPQYLPPQRMQPRPGAGPQSRPGAGPQPQPGQTQRQGPGPREGHGPARRDSDSPGR